MTLLAVLHPAAAEQTGSVPIKEKEIQNLLHERDPNYYTYRTKFGPLVFQKAENSPGLPAEKIILNGKPFSIINGEKDAQGGPLFYLLDDLGSGIEDIEPSTKKDQKPLTRRLLVSIGGDLNCVKKFMILDFTGKKPYVSQRFGFNPNDQFCLKFKKASWGKKESYVTSDDNRYIYYTNGAAFGPIE